MKDFEKWIEKHKQHILSLKDGWADRPSNKAFTLKVWNKAEKIIRKLKNYPLPSIGPCDNNSIDLFWRTKKYSLLANVSNRLCIVFLLRKTTKYKTGRTIRKLKKYLKIMYKDEEK
jgi:hypothetical protein